LPVSVPLLLPERSSTLLVPPPPLPMLQVLVDVQLVIVLKAPPEVKAIVVAPAGPARPKAKPLASIIVRSIDNFLENGSFVSMQEFAVRLFNGLAAFIIPMMSSYVNNPET
jgi:hypothetical protein